MQRMMMNATCRALGSGLLGLAVMGLAACGTHALTATMSRSATVSTGEPGGSSAATSGSELPPGCSPEDAKENCHHWIVLEGLTVEEATRQARAAGFTLDIRVMPLEQYDDTCKVNTVCRADPKRWQLNSDELGLWVNPKVTIAAPD
jgi:hypothetical protein